MRTEVEMADGAIEIYDFAPRFLQGLKVDAPIELCRLLRPLSGTPRVRVHFDPRPDYGRASVEVVAAGTGLEVVGGPTRLHLASNVPAPYLQDESSIRIDRPTFFAFSAGKPPLVSSAPEAENALEQTIRGWRRVGKDHGAAVVRAGVGAAIGALPEAARLHRHRRDHRRGDDQPARSARLGPHLGLPVLLAARCRLRGRGAAAVEPLVGGRSVRAVPARDGRQRPAAADLRHQRQTRSRRRDHPHAAGLRRRRSGAHRQRRVRPAAARRRWRDGAVPRDHPHRSARGVGGSVARAASRAPGRRSHRPRSRSRIRVSGSTARSRGTTRSRRRCAGWPPTAAPSSRSFSACPNAPRSGARGPPRSCRSSSSAPTTRSSASSRRRSTETIRTPRTCCCPQLGLIDPKDPRIHFHRARLREAARPRRVDAALQASPTTSATPPARFRSARSGGSRRWR